MLDLYSKLTIGLFRKKSPNFFVPLPPLISHIDPDGVTTHDPTGQSVVCPLLPESVTGVSGVRQNVARLAPNRKIWEVLGSVLHLQDIFGLGRDVLKLVLKCGLLCDFVRICPEPASHGV